MPSSRRFLAVSWADGARRGMASDPVLNAVAVKNDLRFSCMAMDPNLAKLVKMSHKSLAAREAMNAKENLLCALCVLLLQIPNPKSLEPVLGFEPRTDGLQNRCSTTELNWLRLAAQVR